MKLNLKITNLQNNNNNLINIANKIPVDLNLNLVDKKCILVINLIIL